MKLSIIIPVYNVQQYIERCVRSLMEQTLKDEVEFIFVNDCTPDASMEVLYSVLDEYPNRKKQVRIVENEHNLGVTATRKRGVSEACGEYIGWCDADDWCEKNMFESMLNMSDNGTKDIVVCNYYEDLEDGMSRLFEWERCLYPQECILNKHKGYFLPGSLWQQICKKQILEKSIYQIVDVDYAEDVYTIILECYYAKTIEYVKMGLYHHTKENCKSLLHNISYTYNDWEQQKKNINIITKILCTDNRDYRYRVACNALKFCMKNFFKSVFPSSYSFYREYHECYRDVNEFLFTPTNKRWKTFLVYNNYLLYKLYKV